MLIQPFRVTFTGSEENKLEGDVYGDSGRVVLLLHGGGQTRYAWRAAATRLAERGFIAIAVDQRGHGSSAWIESGAYTIEDYGKDAALLARQIEQRFNTKPVAVGASLGGLASLYAFSQDDGFSALVLVDIALRVQPRGVAQVRDFMRARASEGFASISEAAELVYAYLPHRTKPRSLDGLRKNLRQLSDGRWYWHWDPRFWDGPRSIDAAGYAVYDYLEDIAHSLTVPTLLVRGGSSEIVSAESVEAFRKIVPQARIVDVSGAGHMVAGDKNDAFADAILSFLEGMK